MTEAHNAVLVRRMVEEIWNRGDLRVADLLFTSDYINHAGLIPDLICGPEAIKISVALYRSAFPELQIAIDELTAKRDAVVLRWTARGSATQGSLTGILVSRIADAHKRITHEYFDLHAPAAVSGASHGNNSELLGSDQRNPIGFHGLGDDGDLRHGLCAQYLIINAAGAAS